MLAILGDSEEYNNCIWFKKNVQQEGISGYAKLQ